MGKKRNSQIQLEEPESSLWQERQNLRQGLIHWQNSPVVLVDIDGTLSNPEHRLWMVKGPGKKNWVGFFDQCDKDPPVEIIVRWVRELAKDHTIVLVSGRPLDRTGKKTLWWLKYYRIPYQHLFMRRPGDRRPDTEVKQEILDDLLLNLPKAQIQFAIDDRLSVVEHVWRKNGIRVFPVRSSDADFY